MAEKLLSVVEVAAELDVHRARVLQLIDEGILPATKVGRAYVILASDVEKARNRPPRGRPPAKKAKKK